MKKRPSPVHRFTDSPILGFRVGEMGDRIRSYRNLRVYQNAIEAAMEIFELTKGFPPEEKYSMVDQMRRSSRSVCTNIAEAWRKRRYRAAFVAKLSDAESEACETQVWIDFAVRCKYLDALPAEKLTDTYEQVMGQIVKMIEEPSKWLIRSK
ncbi:MAG TPA: four helix bundle protein [Thermodesulfobacteriota bacterium]|nr:four helix bundle protein [Thermodesulfobacteriota bacterium]